MRVPTLAYGALVFSLLCPEVETAIIMVLIMMTTTSHDRLSSFDGGEIDVVVSNI